MLTASKMLNILSLVGIVFLLVMYLFVKWTFTPVVIGLFVIMLIRLIGQTLKANYYEKEYFMLKNKAQDIINDKQ